MSVAVITTSTVLTGGVAMTTRARRATVGLSATEQDITNLGSAGWKELAAGGIKSGTISIDGMADYVADTNGIATDAEFFANLGVAGAPVSIIPSAAAVGDLAYTAQALYIGVSQFGAVGEVGPLEADIVTSGPVVRGAVLHYTTQTSTGTAAGVQLGAVTAGQSLYVALHHLTRSAGTLTVKVQSDDNSGFTSATDRITFTGSAAGGTYQWSSVAGAITDDYWRAQFTITSGTHLFAVVAGIA